ncbi:MAG: tetratricopeptide repeat protein [Micromonosporaceae bacterium]
MDYAEFHDLTESTIRGMYDRIQFRNASGCTLAARPAAGSPAWDQTPDTAAPHAHATRRGTSWVLPRNFLSRSDHKIKPGSEVSGKAGEPHLRNNLAEAIECLEEALRINRELSAPVGQVWNLVGLASAHRGSGDPWLAIELCEEALAIGQRIGTKHEKALARWQLGLALAEIGDVAQAHQHWKEALPIFERLGTPEAEQIRKLLNVAAEPSR